MAPYRRRPRRTYRWRRRQWRNRYYRPKRNYRRRRWTRRPRRVRVSRRRKKLATFWDPVNKATCRIKGWDVGLFSLDSTSHQRMWRTGFTKTKITKHFEGGGISLRTFDLAYLYMQHRLFHNKWTHTNDGFDLARYFGTKVFLKPHPTVDYIFFWDTDIKEEKTFDICRMHPAQLLLSKNVCFVRSQLTGGNHRTKKVKIKPPANMLNKWARQDLWTDVPLFQFGFATINWKDPFLRQSNYPVPLVQNPAQNKMWMTSGGDSWANQTLTYSPLIDTGKGNMVGVKWVNSTVMDQKPTIQNITWIPWTFDIPYWLSLFGQNKKMDFGVTATDPSTQDQTQIFIKWPQWSVSNILDGKPPGGNYVIWGASYQQFIFIPQSGPFVMPVFNPDHRVNIPFIYTSYWQWGGTQLVQQPINAVLPTSNQISVKNPASHVSSLIYPWDLSGGLLTDAAQARLTSTYSSTDERRPLPFEEPVEGYAYPASSGESSEESEEGEDQQDEEYKEPKNVRKIRQLIQRERNKRLELKSLLRSMVKQHHFM
nr:ORF1 [Torque teno felis virus]